MKKILSVVMTFALLLTVVSMPLAVWGDEASYVKDPFETFETPQYETLTGSPSPGKWMAYSINYGGSMDMTSANFPTATKTPSGDNKSLLANMGWPGAPSDLIKTNAAGSQIDFTNDDGFYITLNSDKTADLIFRIPDFLYDNSFYTVLEVSAGWKTYFIPFESFMQEDGGNGFNRITGGSVNLVAFVGAQGNQPFNSFRIRHMTSANRSASMTEPILKAKPSTAL